MLQNAYLLAKIGADTAENEQHFTEICRSAVVSPTVGKLGPGEAPPALRGADAEGRRERWPTLGEVRAARERDGRLLLPPGQR